MPDQPGYWTAFYRGNRKHVWVLLLLFLVLAAVPWVVVDLVRDLTDEDDAFARVGTTLALIVVAFVQLLPTGIALRRRHPMRTSILVFNILLGWLGPIWIALLVWATTRRGEITLI